MTWTIETIPHIRDREERAQDYEGRAFRENLKAVDMIARGVDIDDGRITYCLMQRDHYLAMADMTRNGTTA